MRYESAREIITSLMGFRSLWMGRERAKATVDLDQIARWQQERAELARKLRGLSVTDLETVDGIRKQYGPEVRRLEAIERSATP
ncbi:MAG TPA: hypothetical protein VFX59_22225 [Polyangiales bacterium]|nr:hypothetical protein [Polyangiales bacterium]